MNEPEHPHLCSCSSEKPYADCCKPFHDGALPKNALSLMRSRFAAYALGNADYIIKTTHPGSPLFQFDKDVWKEEILKFSKATRFERLEILRFTDGSPFSSVTFAAHLFKGLRKASFTEKSYFEYFKGRWLYRNGIVKKGIVRDLDGPDPRNLLPIAYLGQDVLLKKAVLIESITDEIKDLVHDMVETMDALDGIGLAAPQVHQSLRLFVIRRPLEDEEGEVADLGDFTVYINPSLHDPSPHTWSDFEACLSIPGLESEVERPHEILVRYTDLEGNTHEEKASGWYAKALMHEMDHLEGVLFYTLLSKDKQEEMEPFLVALKDRFDQ